MADIAAYKIKDVQLICEWKLTNRRRLFLLLREHLMIARHWFHEGNLALHLAIQNKCTFRIIARSIETWLQSLQVLNDDGKLPLHIAIVRLSCFRSLRMIIMSFPAGLRMTYDHMKLSLHDAVGRDKPLDVRIIKMMVRRNHRSVNERTSNGKNVLHIAPKVKNVPVEIIKYLGNVIRIGAYQEMHSNGMMPLHVACLYQHESIVEYVLEKYIGATQIRDRNGKYPFHYASDRDEHMATQIMHSLLDSFKDVLRSETNDKSLPLHYYVINNPTTNDKLFFLT